MSNLCKLCLVGTDIQKSHAIADSVFKKIFRTNSGKAITFSDNKEYVSHSSDSWSEYQLCSCCEDKLNKRYEKYSLQVLRAQNVDFSRSEYGLIFKDINSHKLNMYFLSILWRATNSSHSAYKNLVLLKKDNEYLRSALLNDLSIPVSRFTVKIERLIDRTKVGGFSRESLRELILSPFTRVNRKNNVKGISACFVFEGFFIEIFIPGLPLKNRNSTGIVKKQSKCLIIPFIDIFDIEEMVDIMARSYGKYLNGKKDK